VAGKNTWKKKNREKKKDELLGARLILKCEN
jgi:hypothetical protein